MAIRDLFTPSFRNRLRLFFVVIVIIPMIAVGFVLFRLVRESDNSQADAQVNLAQKVAVNLYRQSSMRADMAGRAIVGDAGLRQAIADKDARAIEARLTRASRSVGARRVILQLNGQGRFAVGR